MNTSHSDKKIRYTANPDYIHRQTAGEHLLIPVGNAVARFNGVIELNESAVFLWDALKTARTREELSDLLAEAFGLCREQADEDTAEFLSELTAHGMAAEVGEEDRYAKE